MVSADPAPPALLTSADVAAALGITPRRVQALARSRGVGRRVGRDWVFTAADLDALRVRKAGRPRKGGERPA